jgi:hypothetical protein
MKQLTTLKLFGRKKGWNEKIRRMLAKVRNRKFAQGFKDDEGVLINCPAESIHPTSEKGYTLKELLSFPLNIQTFVIEQIYSGKEIIFLYEEKTIVGVKTKDEQGESTYKLILKE